MFLQWGSIVQLLLPLRAEAPFVTRLEYPLPTLSSLSHDIQLYPPLLLSNQYEKERTTLSMFRFVAVQQNEETALLLSAPTVESL